MFIIEPKDVDYFNFEHDEQLELIGWLYENIDSNPDKFTRLWIINLQDIRFVNEVDAAAFKLRWL